MRERMEERLVSVLQLEIMEGVERVYRTSVEYAKGRYVPDTAASVVSILLYTVMVFVLTEVLMRGKLTRWLYLGSVAMVVSMVYAGQATTDDLRVWERREEA